MIRYFQRNPAFWLVSQIHAYWALALCFSDTPLHTTPLSALNTLTGGSRWVVAVLLVLGVAGAWKSLYGARNGTRWRLLQMFLVGTTMFSDIRLIAVGHYADFVERSRWFLSADQAPFIVLGLFYMMTTRRRAA